MLLAVPVGLFLFCRPVSLVRFAGILRLLRITIVGLFRLVPRLSLLQRLLDEAQDEIPLAQPFAGTLLLTDQMVLDPLVQLLRYLSLIHI